MYYIYIAEYRSPRAVGFSQLGLSINRLPLRARLAKKNQEKRGELLIYYQSAMP